MSQARPAVHGRRRTRRRTRSGGAEQSIRHDSGVAGCCCASRASIGQPPREAAAVAGEGEQYRSGTPAVTRVPRAALYPALAAAQVCRERVGAGMAGQVCQGGGSRGGDLKGSGGSGAGGADERRAAYSRVQLHCPDTPHCGMRAGKPHWLVVLPTVRAALAGPRRQEAGDGRPVVRILNTVHHPPSSK